MGHMRSFISVSESSHHISLYCYPLLPDIEFVPMQTVERQVLSDQYASRIGELNLIQDEVSFLP